MISEDNVKWYSITVDSGVFTFLQRNALPLIDTANDVLRRLLLKEVPAPRRGQKITRPKEEGGPLVDSATFVQFLLSDRFGDGFRRVGRYRYMFESDKELVYFQNYNKETDLLWYRVSKKPRNTLSSSRKRGWLCLTNPAEKYAYIIPISELEARAKECGWPRAEFEIHIYPQTSCWHELIDWHIDRFKYNLR